MNINNILITSQIYTEVEKIIENYSIEKNIRYKAEDNVTKDDLFWADAYVSFRPTNNFEFGNIKWVHSFGAGVDSFLYNREWKDDVLLTRTICSFGERIGEYCLSYILKDLQFHQRFTQLNTEKHWLPITPNRLCDQKVIIFGTGVIGQETAKLLTSLGLGVYGVSQSGNEKEFFKEIYSTNDQLIGLEKMDYVINTLPLTDDTYKKFNKEFFNQLSSAIFINVGRGKSVDDQALIMALDNGNVRQAVLDVFSEEPLPKDNIFWDRSDVIVTPHISAVTTPEEAVECFVDTLQNIENGKSLSNEVKIGKGF